MLPEIYQDIPNSFRIQKRCTPFLSSSRNKEKVLVATTGPHQIILSLAVFAGTDIFAKKIIAHELTHALDRQRDLSSEKSFRQIHQWSRTWYLNLQPDKTKTEAFYRDQGEIHPKEDLATAAEGYFFDPEFLCNQPAMYLWLSTHLGPSLSDRSECKGNTTPLDPAKIKAVGYMFISSSQENVESSFGHSVLHFHNMEGNPYDDIIIQAAGNVTGQPLVTGFETPAEINDKLKQAIQVSRLGLLLRGATGQLDAVVQPIRYRAKWLETVILEGRDIHEKILKLSAEQLRALIYMINRDVQGTIGSYGFFLNNCATYIGLTLNKVYSSEIIEPHAFGIYSPEKIYRDINPITEIELPVVEGDQTRLRRLLPRRTLLIQSLSSDPTFSQIDFDSLSDSPTDPDQIYAALTALEQLYLTSLELSIKGLLSPDLLRDVNSLIHTFSLESSFRLKRRASEIYKDMLRLKVRQILP